MYPVALALITTCKYLSSMAYSSTKSPSVDSRRVNSEEGAVGVVVGATGVLAGVVVGVAVGAVGVLAGVVVGVVVGAVGVLAGVVIGVAVGVVGAGGVEVVFTGTPWNCTENDP